MTGSHESSDDYLYSYYTTIRPSPKVLELCGAAEPGAPYSPQRDSDLTCIINAYSRPEYLPLIWEGVQLQSRRPAFTWIVQNHPIPTEPVPSAFLSRMRSRDDTVVIESGLNHGCWFRFLLAALYCKTRYVIILDDDTLPGRLSFETALASIEAEPAVYGGRGLILKKELEGPRYWSHEVYGWPVGSGRVEVDFVGQMWVLETHWLPELFRHLPRRLFSSPDPGRQCGEEMYVSHVAQKMGLRSYVYPHGMPYNARWSSLQAYEMGNHPAAMHMTGGLSHSDQYLQEFIRDGWQLLRYTATPASAGFPQTAGGRGRPKRVT